MGRPINETGRRYGRLLVVRRAKNAPDGDAQWLCRCSCGGTAVVRGRLLRKGKTRSCGCLRLDALELANEKAHGTVLQGARSRKRWGPHAPRFWGRVDKSGDCWLWTGGTSSGGYGAATWPNGQQTTAHRVSWEITYGPIPDGMQVLHRCDNPACVRPDHLFLGTQQDNMDDMIAKGRKPMGCAVLHAPQNGESNNNAKLTEDVVRRIKQRLAEGAHQCDVAREFGATKTNVWAIAHGKSWTHV